MLRPVTIWPHKGQHTQSSHNLSRSYTNPNHIYANSPIFTKILHRPTPSTCIVTNNKQLSVFTVFFNKLRRKKTRIFMPKKCSCVKSAIHDNITLNQNGIWFGGCSRPKSVGTLCRNPQKSRYFVP